MGTTGLAVFDTTVQETNLWLKAATTGTSPTWRCERRCMPCAIGSARRTPFIWPRSCRCCCGLYYEGWRLAASQTRERTRADFLEHVRSELPRGIDTELAARAVFEVMWQKLDLGEVGKVLDLLPEQLKELWR